MFENDIMFMEQSTMACQAANQNAMDQLNMAAHRRMVNGQASVVTDAKAKFEFDLFQHGIRTSVAIGDIAKKGLDQLNAFVNEELHFLYDLRKKAPAEYASTIDKMAKDVLHDYEFHKRFAVAKRGF